MKHRLQIAAVVMTVLWLNSAVGRAGIVSPYPDNGMPTTAVLYHLDEASGATTATDSSGNGLSLSASTSSFAGEAGPEGLSGAGGIFDAGAKQLARNLSNGEAALLDTDTFTIEAWVKNPNRNNIGSTLSDQMAIFAYRNGNANRVSLRLTTAFKLGLAFQDDADQAFELIESTEAFSFEQDVWYHVAATYDNNGSAAANDSTMAFYITAVSDLSGEAQLLGSVLDNQRDIEPLTDGGTLRVGGTDSADHRSFGGYLDEVRYTNVALAADDFNLAVPEPASFVTLVVGLVGLAGFGWRQRRLAR